MHFFVRHEAKDFRRLAHSLANISALPIHAAAATQVEHEGYCKGHANLCQRCLALPRVLSFDKSKGNANGERFQWILTAPEERHILDILPDRRGFRHPILPTILF